MTTMPKSLDDLLEDIAVHEPGMWENEQTATMGDWYAVSTENECIVAYFLHRSDAFRFRLDLINLALNARKVV